jgi:apolipoprotein N-acyltransferase
MTSTSPNPIQIMKEVLQSRWFHFLYLVMLALASLAWIGRNIVDGASFQIWVLTTTLWAAPVYLGYCAARFLISNKAQG